MTEGPIPAMVLSSEQDTSEILALAASAGHSVVRTFIQRRERPDPEFYIGEGKVKEIAHIIALPGE